jgi:serine/threonine protein kinase
MAIPDEYKIEEVVRKTENMMICRADHPIHGKVFIYVPDDALHPEVAAIVKRHLYQSGIQMRGISQLYLPFVTKTLEVSQNPNEPYIITEYSKYDLEKLINEDVRLKPKRIYQIFSKVLQAIMGLSENGWQTDNLNPYQIKLSGINQGDVTVTALLSTGLQPIVPGPAPAPEVERAGETVTLKDDAAEKTQTLKKGVTIDQSRSGMEPTATMPQDAVLAGEKELRLVQRNIYILGGLAYQLLFGKKYHLSDSNAVVNIRKLSAKWRAVLEKALSPSLEERYESYESMLRDIERALSRNKRIAISITPLVVLLLMAGGLFGYRQHHRHQIMTSEAGQAIKNFLEIVDKTESNFPEPSSASQEPNDDSILRPFDEIATTPDKKE